MGQNISIDSKYKNLYNLKKLEPSTWRKIGAENKINNIKKLLASESPVKILEIGCGDGALLFELSQQKIGKKLYGVEITESLVKTVKNRKIPNLKECVLFDGYNTHYANDDFDLVILSHVVEHVEYPRILINEAKRIGKMIIFEVPLEATIILKKDFVLTSTGHINFYSYKTFRNLIQTCNLKILCERISNPSLKTYKFQGGIHNIFKYFIREFSLFIFGKLITSVFTYHYTILCVKSHD